MADSDQAIFRVVIRGSIDAVWREITKTDEINRAFFNSMMHTPGLEPGAPIQMRTPNGKYASVVGEVLEFDPPRRFSHTFKFTHLDDPPCKVTYDLREVDEGVEFTLTVDDMPSGTKTAKSMSQGGPMIVRTVKSIVETGKPPLAYRILGRIFALLGPLMTPKRCRVENWPLETSRA